MNQDRAVLVTGAASGIGLGVAKAFAAEGHPVAMLDVQEALLGRESEALRATGARVFARKVDVGDRSQVDEAYAAIRREFGPVLIVIANAGISETAEFRTLSMEAWRRMIDINLTGVFNTLQPAIEDMAAAKWGRIVTISSQAAQSGAQDRAHYAAAKGGVMGLTRSLGRELAPLGITANTIPPSLVATPMAEEGVRTGQVPSLEVIARNIPIARPGTPDDIAQACVFLASDKASYITGQTLNVNGGSWM